MSRKTRFPDWVPKEVVEHYNEWVTQTGQFALPPDYVATDFEPPPPVKNAKTSLAVAYKCLESLMRSPAMKAAWASVERHSESVLSNSFANRLVSLIASYRDPFPLGTSEDASTLRNAADKLEQGRKLMGITGDADFEFLGRGTIKKPDGSLETIFEPEMRQWFHIPPSEAITNLCEWLRAYADSIENFARDGTSQPKSPRAPTQKLISRLSELMIDMYGRPLDDTVAATAEGILAFFGSDEMITRERVMQSRKPAH